MRIYVGNLSYTVEDEELKELFTQYGAVESAYVPTDRATGRPRGFAFLEMPDRTQAQSAIQALNGKDLKGRPIVVNEARPREETNNRAPRGNFSNRR